jgi:hypothetical protein
MPPKLHRRHPEFSEQTLTQLLEALHARTAGHPDNPGLIACWPRIPESRMAAACAVLHGRGHPVFQTTVTSAVSGTSRRGWTIAATTDQPIQLPPTMTGDATT